MGSTSLNLEDELFLKQYFLLVDPLGNLLEGLEAMSYWCEKQQLSIQKTIET